MFDMISIVNKINGDLVDKSASISTPPLISKNANKFGSEAFVYRVSPTWAFTKKPGEFMGTINMSRTGGGCWSSTSIEIPIVDVPQIIEALKNTYKNMLPLLEDANKKYSESKEDKSIQ